VRLDRHIGVDPSQRLRQRIHLSHPDLIDKILLTIEITRDDDVKVGENQATNSHPRHRDGDLAAKPAEPGHPDP